MDKIVLELLRKNNINNISKEELKFQISSHPSYPSLHAITGVLDHFGIENMALDIPQNSEVFEQLPKYFIAQLKNDTSQDIVSIERNENQVTVKYIDKKKIKLTKKQFLQNWTGIVVVVDEEELAITDKKSILKIIRFLPLILLIGITVFVLIQFTSLNILNLLYLVLSLAGVYISTLLIKHELGINSNTVSKLCASTEKTSCDAVLNSKAATIFGMFKLSDLSFVYFSSLAITALIINLTTHNIGLLTTLSLFAVPVVIYSVYYQGVVVKKWCPLCLAIGSVLLLQPLTSYLLNPIILTFEIKGFLILTTTFLSIITIYSKVKPLISSKIELTKSKVAYYKFKRNFNLFKTLHHNKPTLDTSITKINEITFGNKNAKIKLVAITNPLCGYCKATHQAIDTLLNNNSKNLKVIIRFNIYTEDKENQSYKIANILLNLYQNDATICREAMHQIYTDGVDVNKWLTTYNNYNKTNFYEVLETEKQWCLDNNINFTPAVYLNNKEFPKEYDLSDLSFFMDELVDEKNEITVQNAIPTELESATRNL